MINYIDDNDIEGLPQQYKNLLIHPLRLKNISQYNILNRYLTVTKNHIPDKNIIKMSMFKFIIYVYQQELNSVLENKIDVAQELIDLFSVVLKPSDGTIENIDIVVENIDLVNPNIDNFQDLNTKLRLFLCLTIRKKTIENRAQSIIKEYGNYISYEDGFFSFNYDSTNKLNSQEKIELINKLNKEILLIDEEETINLLYTEQDFDEIREILLKQNGISLDYVNQFNPSLEEKLQNFHRDSSYANFDEQIFSLASYMREHTEQIRDKYTFYQFKKYIQRIGLYTEYMMMKPLEISGQIKMKNGTIEHWLSHIPEKGRYEEILIAKNKFVNENDIFKSSQIKNQ